MPKNGVSVGGAVTEDARAGAADEVTLVDVGVTEGRTNFAPLCNV